MVLARHRLPAHRPNPRRRELHRLRLTGNGRSRRPRNGRTPESDDPPRGFSNMTIRRSLALLFLWSVALASNSLAQPAPQTWDVVIYGGTCAAVTAAVQAKKMGKSV